MSSPVSRFQFFTTPATVTFPVSPAYSAFHAAVTFATALLKAAYRKEPVPPSGSFISV